MVGRMLLYDGHSGPPIFDREERLGDDRMTATFRERPLPNLLQFFVRLDHVRKCFCLQGGIFVLEEFSEFYSQRVSLVCTRIDSFHECQLDFCRSKD